MSKLRLTMNSSPCQDPQGDIYAMVDVTCNGASLQENLQLGASDTVHTWDATINTGSDNTVVIDITNAVGYDTNSNGDLSDSGETVKVNVTGVEYSTDDTNYTSLLPQTQVTHTVPSGANSGTEITLKPAITSIELSFESNTVKFNTTDGLVNTDQVLAVYVTVDGDTYTQWDGTVLDN